MILSVRPSVCHTVMEFQQIKSYDHVVFTAVVERRQRLFGNFAWVQRSGARNKRGVGENCEFSAKLAAACKLRADCYCGNLNLVMWVGCSVYTVKHYIILAASQSGDFGVYL